MLYFSVANAKICFWHKHRFFTGVNSTNSLLLQIDLGEPNQIRLFNFPPNRLKMSVEKNDIKLIQFEALFHWYT